MKLDRMRSALQQGRPVRDEDFDSIYPLEYRRVSARFWTPVATARRVAEMLEGEGARRVLDIGAGVGKFCIVGALTTTRTTFVGIEQRAHLVVAACEGARALGAERADVRSGRLDDLRLDFRERFDGFYLFNPFAENTFGRSGRLDHSIELSEARYRADVALAETLLASAPPRTPVVTYCGYGGKMRPGYDLVHSEPSAAGPLYLWVKADRPKAVRASA